MQSILVFALLAAGAFALDSEPRMHVTRPAHAVASLDTQRVVHRIAFGSCNKHNRNQSYWRAIRARSPDVWVWLGDVIYADTPVLLKWRLPARPETLVAYYEAQLSSPEYAALLSDVPVVGVYDDHDQGTNVSARRSERVDPTVLVDRAASVG